MYLFTDGIKVYHQLPQSLYEYTVKDTADKDVCTPRRMVIDCQSECYTIQNLGNRPISSINSS